MSAFFMKHWPIMMRCALYFLIAFIPTALDGVQAPLKLDHWPSPQNTILSILVGLIAGLTAVRAYFDGSAERHMQQLNTEKNETTTTVNNPVS